MVNNAIALLNAARQNAGKTTVVLTSSTGSTNPPGAAADALKNELDFWEGLNSPVSYLNLRLSVAICLNC